MMIYLIMTSIFGFINLIFEIVLCKRKLSSVIYTIIHFVFMPILFPFMIIYFILALLNEDIGKRYIEILREYYHDFDE